VIKWILEMRELKPEAPSEGQLLRIAKRTLSAGRNGSGYGHAQYCAKPIPALQHGVWQKHTHRMIRWYKQVLEYL